MTVEGVEGEALYVVENPQTQREQEALGDPGPEVVVAERDQRANQVSAR